MGNADDIQETDADSHDELVNQILAAAGEVGALEDWTQQRLNGSTNSATLQSAYRLLTRQLVATESPDVGVWEHVVVTTAISAEKAHLKQCLEACGAALEELQAVLEKGQLDGAPPEQLVTLASALTLLLAARHQLRQGIETVIELLADRHPQQLQSMAERCQDIWKRHGQMSGVDGLYVWDRRQGEWRLEQDFKPYRPEPPAA